MFEKSTDGKMRALSPNFPKLMGVFMTYVVCLRTLMCLSTIFHPKVSAHNLVSSRGVVFYRE